MSFGSENNNNYDGEYDDNNTFNEENENEDDNDEDISVLSSEKENFNE